MVLGAHVVLCMRAGFFENNIFAQKMDQKQGFLDLLENLVISFFLILIYKESLYYLLYCSTNPIFWGNLVPEIWAKILLVNQIAGFLNQLDLQNKVMKRPDFLHVDTNLWRLKVAWNILGEGVVKNECGYSGLTGLNWFMVCWWEFREVKSYFNNFWVVVIQNACGILLGHGTLKSAASQGLIDVKSWFFACWYKFRKAKNYFNDYWVGIVKSEWDLLDHETLKSRVLHKWFTEPSRLIEWYLHADSDEIIFVLIVQYTSYIWRLMLEVHKTWLSVKIGNCPKPRYSSSAWLSTSTISKFCYPT